MKTSTLVAVLATLILSPVFGAILWVIPSQRQQENVEILDNRINYLLQENTKQNDRIRELELKIAKLEKREQ